MAIDGDVLDPQFSQLFPHFFSTGGKITSPASIDYNCIAWAAGDTTRPWWPGVVYWPEGVTCEESVAAFIQAYQTLGYSPCTDESLEEGFEKIALYAIAGVVKHAARQLPTGLWTSKLGQGVDVEHNLEGLTGPFYGSAVQFLKRPLGS